MVKVRQEIDVFSALVESFTLPAYMGIDIDTDTDTGRITGLF